MEVEGRELLQDASRKVRIEALTRFPVLVKALIEQVDAGLKAIDDAEKFVN